MAVIVALQFVIVSALLVSDVGDFDSSFLRGICRIKFWIGNSLLISINVTTNASSSEAVNG